MFSILGFDRIKKTSIYKYKSQNNKILSYIGFVANFIGIVLALVAIPFRLIDVIDPPYLRI